MSDPAVRQVFRLGQPPWPTLDPFLFCVHHHDRFPAGDESMGVPREQLVGRNIGSDFSGRDGWSMYHGDSVPGFPRHPHRGFETVTLARQGYIDHTDSLGASARFGHGDVQWMTAGRGVVHCEMFPLVNTDAPNPTELFQIWLNLPRASKMVDPYFTMFWGESLPTLEANGVKLTVVAGAVPGVDAPPAPPPDSWASRPDSDVAIWTLELSPGGRIALPPASAAANRVLYVFEGEGVRVASTDVDHGHGVVVVPEVELELANPTDVRAEVLVLQGRPIGEPVAQHGPFVMNDRQGIQEAIADYQRTQFGGWPWPEDTPVHGHEGRFARHADGQVERPD